MRFLALPQSFFILYVAASQLSHFFCHIDDCIALFLDLGQAGLPSHIEHTF